MEKGHTLGRNQGSGRHSPKTTENQIVKMAQDIQQNVVSLSISYILEPFLILNFLFSPVFCTFNAKLRTGGPERINDLIQDGMMTEVGTKRKSTKMSSFTV